MSVAQNAHYGAFSPELEQHLAASASNGGLMAPNIELSELRTMLRQAEESTWNAFSDNLQTEDVEVPLALDIDYKVPVRIWRQRNSRKQTRPLALVIHGGGWTLGSQYADSFLTRTLVHDLDMVVVTCDYRLSPEHPYPAALDDIKAVLSWMTASNDGIRKALDPELLEPPSQSIFLCGFSAGANIAAALMLWMRDQSRAHMIRAQILISPATCHYRAQEEAVRRLGCELSSMESVRGAILSGEQITGFWDNYYPKQLASPGDQSISPLLVEDCSGLPPTYIQVSGADPLRDEGIAYAERLAHAGVKTDLKVYSGMPHAYQSDLLGIPSREKALKDLVDWIQTDAER